MGVRSGEHRVPGRTGTEGIEIGGHRPYAPGDDLRHLDWNAFGRLDQLVVRRFTAERAAAVHLLLDASASMGVPARDRKLATASALAETLGAIALATGDSVRVALLGGAPGARLGPTLRGRGMLMHLRALLAAVTPGGSVAIGAALRAYARTQPRPGVAIVLSDFTGEADELVAGILALRARRYDVVLLHVVGPGELDPSREFSSGVLRDVESGETRPMRLTRTLRARYAAILAEHLAALRAVAERTGAAYARIVTGTPALEAVSGELVRLGIVRRR